MSRRPELLLSAMLLSATLAAQQARWNAPVPAVRESGLHAIALSAELLGSARADLGDIRLIDSAGVEVPYVLREVMRASGPEHFVPYNLLRNAVLKHRTEVEIERPSDGAVEELHVWVKPIDAEKRLRITGSDDREAWYMVKDEHVAVRGSRGDPPHQVLVLRIPRSDYRYLRLTFNDSLAPPMKVLGVGRFMPERAPEHVHAAPVVLRFAQRDSARQTLLRFTLPQALLVERFMIDVADTLPFRRRMELSALRSAEVQDRNRKRRQRWWEQMGSFTLQRDGGSAFSLMPARLDTFELRIENGDDQPLRIEQVRAACQARVMLARMEPGVSYRLVLGNTELAPPRYDMSHFAGDLPAPVDTLAHGPMERLPDPVEARPPFDPSSAWVWAAIIALIALMGWMALRMLKKP